MVQTGTSLHRGLVASPIRRENSAAQRYRNPKCPVKTMAEYRSDPLAIAVYELAERFVWFRYRAEHFWCDDEDDRGSKDLRFLARDKDNLRVMALEISEMADAKSAATELVMFAETVESFWLKFHDQWEDAARKRKLQEMRNTEPEQMYDRDRYMLKDSPMQNGLWDDVQAAMNAVVRQLDPAAAACLNIGVMLAAELHSTFAGGQRNRSDDEELAYYAVDFSPKLKKAMEVMVENYPYLGQLNPDLCRGNNQSLEDEIRKLWRQIGEQLNDPGKAPGYLGLVLDQQGRRVGRNGKWERLTGKLLWEMLKRLESFGTDLCPIGNLKTVWSVAYPSKGAPTPEAIYAAVKELNKILRELDINIKAEREIGYRLEEIIWTRTARRRRGRRI
jgi:hypothetical protein